MREEMPRNGRRYSASVNQANMTTELREIICGSRRRWYILRTRTGKDRSEDKPRKSEDRERDLIPREFIGDAFSQRPSRTAWSPADFCTDGKTRGRFNSASRRTVEPRPDEARNLEHKPCTCMYVCWYLKALSRVMFYERSCVIAATVARTVARSPSVTYVYHVAMFRDRVSRSVFGLRSKGWCIKGEPPGFKLNDGLNDRERLIWSVIYHVGQARGVSGPYMPSFIPHTWILEFSDEKLISFLEWDRRQN